MLLAPRLVACQDTVPETMLLMAQYTVSHPELPQELNGTTFVRTRGGRCTARSLAAAHVAAILRHRGIRPCAQTEDVYDAITVTKVER